MKKILFYALLITNCALLFSGCGSDDKVKVGSIKYLNVTEEAMSNLYANNCQFIFFDNMSNMTAALDANQINELSTYESVANYLIASHQDFELARDDFNISDLFCCAMREEDADLKKEFDDAIKTLSANGKLAHLVKEYVIDSNHLETPPVIDFPTFYGATTVKIALTGDLPLMDYFRPDGLPAGFNIALLAEISKLIEKNFVFVQVDSGARAIALTSKQVDVIFWVVVPKDNDILPVNLDKPDGIILTEPYFLDNLVRVKLRK